MLSGCVTAKPAVLVETQIVRDKVPAALLKACPSAFNKPIRITGDFIKRGDVNEAALKKCAAQVAAIKKWDERP